MRSLAMFLAAALWVAPAAWSDEATTLPAGKIELRILYAGHAGSGREKEFVDFLGQHFKAVQAVELLSFKPDQAEGFDVVLMDYDGDAFKTRFPAIPKTYTRPTVTLGKAGSMICSQMRLKTGYL